eukprot:1089883-Rhodomonas_salina.5
MPAPTRGFQPARSLSFRAQNHKHEITYSSVANKHADFQPAQSLRASQTTDGAGREQVCLRGALPILLPCVAYQDYVVASPYRPTRALRSVRHSPTLCGRRSKSSAGSYLSSWLFDLKRQSAWLSERRGAGRWGRRRRRGRQCAASWRPSPGSPPLVPRPATSYTHTHPVSCYVHPSRSPGLLPSYHSLLPPTHTPSVSCYAHQTRSPGLPLRTTPRYLLRTHDLLLCTPYGSPDLTFFVLLCQSSPLSWYLHIPSHAMPRTQST